MVLPIPVRRQKEVLYLPEKGHLVVLGTAGSGKTTLAILRAAHLQSLGGGSQRTLLVTFNKTLVTYLQSIAKPQLKNVNVETYHRFALGYLHSKGKMGSGCIAGRNERTLLIRKAILEARRENPDNKILWRPEEVFTEELQWIEKCGIGSLEDYINAERVGRQDTRIPRKNRPVFYDIYQRYLVQRSRTRYLYDWDDIGQAVVCEFEKDSTPRMYKHIVIDEGQDFSPTMLKSLVHAASADGSLTFFGDMAQQIYGTRLSWRSAGLKARKVWEFKENYRNTRQVARLALAMSRLKHFKGVPDLVEPTTPVAAGPLPTVVPCRDRDKQLDLAIDQARQIGLSQKVAILMRRRNIEKRYIGELSRLGLPVHKLSRDMAHWAMGPGVFVGTYHSAKGLEFDTVILPYCSDDYFLTKSRIRALGSIEEVMSEEGQLLYVGVTRAKVNLIILYSGTLTSLLPTDDSLYSVVKP